MTRHDAEKCGYEDARDAIRTGVIARDMRACDISAITWRIHDEGRRRNAIANTLEPAYREALFSEVARAMLK